MELVRLIKSHPTSAGPLAFHPKETYLLASGGSGVGGIQIWNVDTGDLHKKLDVASDTFHKLSFDLEGRHLVSGDGQGRITLWDTHSWTVERVIGAHQGRIFRIAVSPDGYIVASSSFSDKTLKLWDIRNGEKITTLDFGEFAFHPFKPFVAIARQKQFSLYDFGSGEFVKVVQLEQAVGVRLTYSADGRHLAAETESERICLYDAENLSERVIDNTFEFQCPVFSANSQSVAATYYEYPLIAVWDIETYEQIDKGECDQPLDTPEALVFNSDGSLIACSYGWRSGGIIAIWRL